MKVALLILLSFHSVFEITSQLISRCPNVKPVHVTEHLLKGRWYMVRRSIDYSYPNRAVNCRWDISYNPDCRVVDMAAHNDHTGWHFNMTVTTCHKSYITSTKCKSEMFKLYKPTNDRTNLGSFYQTTERFWCIPPFCYLNSQHDQKTIHTIKRANFYILHVDQEFVLVYSCQICKGAIGKADDMAFVLSRVPKPDLKKVNNIEAKLLQQHKGIMMMDAYVSACDDEKLINSANKITTVFEPDLK